MATPKTSFTFSSKARDLLTFTGDTAQVRVISVSSATTIVAIDNEFQASVATKDLKAAGFKPEAGTIFTVDANGTILSAKNPEKVKTATASSGSLRIAGRF